MKDRRAKPTGWEVIDVGAGEVHLVPTDDLVEHTQDEECICGPNTQYLDNGKMIIHASLDGREIEEQRRKK